MKETITLDSDDLKEIESALTQLWILESAYYQRRGDFLGDEVSKKRCELGLNKISELKNKLNKARGIE